MIQNQKNKYNVVIQLTSDNVEIQKSLINQINNLINSIPEINIEVVVHNKGIKMLLKDTSLKNNLTKSYKAGVQFLACNNSLSSHKLNSIDILGFCIIIPSGVAHIVKRQYEGWAYLKAG